MVWKLRSLRRPLFKVSGLGVKLNEMNNSIMIQEHELKSNTGFDMGKHLGRRAELANANENVEVF